MNNVAPFPARGNGRPQMRCHKCNASMVFTPRYPEPHEYHCPMADCSEFCWPWRLVHNDDGSYVLEANAAQLNAAPVRVPTGRELGWYA